MVRLVKARCGMIAHTSMVVGIATIRRAGAAVLESETGAMSIYAANGRPGAALFSGGFDDYQKGPGGFDDNFAAARDITNPVLLGGDLVDPNDPLAHNVLANPTTAAPTSLAEVWTEITALKQAVSGISDVLDPGDLTPSFTSHL